MSQRRLAYGITLAFLAATACDDGPTGGEREGVVGPTGGVVAVGADASVTIPPGALSREIVVQITAVATPADLEAQGAIGQAYRFEPVSQTFAVPVQVAIRVPAAALGGRSIDEVTILRSTDPTTDRLTPASEELGSIVRSADGTVSGTTTRLGVFSAAIPNRGPSADAGADRNVAVGTVVVLSGAGEDPEDDALDFSWSFVSRPAGSAATIANAGSANASFLADVTGIYEVRLTVSDAHGNTATDTVRIVASPTTGNRAPVADAGADLTGSVGQTVTLDGSRSSDPDGDTVSFSWRFLLGSPAAPSISNANQARASFVPTASGTYVLELTVSDATLSDSDTVRVTVGLSNRAPTLTVAVPPPVFPGSTMEISASATDVDGDPVAIAFALVSSPAGSAARLTTTGNVTRITPDVIGGYEVRVTANDGQATVSETVFVYANPMVAGVYASTFHVASADGCADRVRAGDSATGDMAVTQPTPGTLGMDLAGLHSAVVTNPTLQLFGETAQFTGPLTLRSGSTTFNVNGSFLGPITAAGSLNLSFSFTAFGVCRVTGTVTGTRR